MVTRIFLKSFFAIISLPHLIISLVFEIFFSKNICHDLEKCFSTAEKYQGEVPQILIDALVIGEDHRNAFHPGIDVLAMFRALYASIGSGTMQGASTIEQQYVRVISGRYERTLSRKVREQILAIILARKIDKKSISSAYLCIAFYGSGIIGLNGLKKELGNDLSSISLEQAIKMISHLKFPRPLNYGENWESKINSRIKTLKIRNKNLQKIN